MTILAWPVLVHLKACIIGQNSSMRNEMHIYCQMVQVLILEKVQFLPIIRNNRFFVEMCSVGDGAESMDGICCITDHIFRWRLRLIGLLQQR